MASDPMRWPTALTSVDTTRVLIRGYAIDELMGRVSFGDAIYLLTTGELPSPAMTRLIDAVLVGFIDHGAAAPSTLDARRAAKAGATVNGAVASGILGLDRPGATNVRACRELIESGLDLAGSSMLFSSSAADLAELLVQRDEIPPPGFGHRHHTSDPRVTRLLQVAYELGIDHVYAQYLRSLEHALSRHPALADERLPINIDGAIAAVCGDLGFDAPTSEGLAVIARVPGLLAHAIEERSRPTVGSLEASTVEYDGPMERRIRDRR